jgi:hypothetical protein
MNNLEMIATIECYLHHKLDKEIRLNEPKTPRQFFLLTKAYENCKGFFIKH